MNKNLGERIHPIAEADGLSPKIFVIVECDSDTEKIPAIEVSWDGEYKNSIILEDARYVHELQHAMRLVGIEKEIKIL